MAGGAERLAGDNLDYAAGETEAGVVVRPHPARGGVLWQVCEQRDKACERVVPRSAAYAVGAITDGSLKATGVGQEVCQRQLVAGRRVTQSELGDAAPHGRI